MTLELQKVSEAARRAGGVVRVAPALAVLNSSEGECVQRGASSVTCATGSSRQLLERQ